MSKRQRRQHATPRRISGLFNGAAVAGLTALVYGCAGPAAKTQAPLEAGLSCVDDSAACRQRRQSALEVLLADQQRSWINRPPDARAYASGVRLFAYQKRKRELTCGELVIGISEAKGARATLRAASDRLTPAQIARGAMLGDEIEKQLQRERRRRCKS